MRWLAWGLAYDAGKGAPQDYVEALKWYRKAAEAGNSWGMVDVGAMYEGGLGGLPKDYGQAITWYRKAAEGGNPNAMIRLGVMYEKGVGVAKSLPLALQWYRKAADTGDAEAKLGSRMVLRNLFGSSVSKPDRSP